MEDDLRILILEDVATDAELAEFELREAGFAFISKRVATEKEYVRELQSFAPHLILSDYDLPHYNGAYALAEAKTRCPDIPFILVTGAVGEDRAIEILTQGAQDYVLKNRINRLVPAVQRALAEAEAHKARRQAEEALRKAHDDLENEVKKRTAELRNEIAVREQAEESLRRSEENLRLALDASEQGIWDWNLVEGTLVWSDKCKTIHGLKADADVSGDLFFQLVHPEDRERIREAVFQALEQGRDYDEELRVIWPDATVHWLSAKGRGFYDEKWKPIRMIGVTRDITERRRLEDDLLNARKLESIGTLAGGIAHDFNNLLAVIQGYIDLARISDPLPDRVSTPLEASERAIRQAEELTNHLMTFAQGGKPNRQRCDIRELIRETVERTATGWPMELSYTIDDDLWLVEVDEGQIRQVIRHLAVNAKEAMPEGGVLKIGAKNLHVKNHDLLPVAEGTYVRISVEDTGIGISEKDLNHIFDPYYSTKQIGTQKGMGLALAVCYSIVNRHHGCITAASQKGEGSSFHVYLPVMTGETSVKSLIPKKRQEVKKSRKKVLVMDDESMVREVTEHLLTASGYDVELASDGLEAISLYVKANEANDPFNVVFLDLSVKGGLGGKPTLKRLMEIDPHVMAIVSTGYTDDPIIHDFRDYGFMGAVTKPFTLEKLTGALAKVC